MPRLKPAVLAIAGAVALASLPITPAAAAGPLLFAPWAIGHALGAMARLATLPLVAAAQFQPPAAYPSGAPYGGPPQGYQPQAPAYYPPQQGYYPAPQPYYSAPQPYYAAPPAYYAAPRAYYGAAPGYGYAPAAPRFYGPPRGDYAPRARYAGSYAPHAAYRSGGYGYRRR